MTETPTSTTADLSHPGDLALPVEKAKKAPSRKATKVKNVAADEPSTAGVEELPTAFTLAERIATHRVVEEAEALARREEHTLAVAELEAAQSELAVANSAWDSARASWGRGRDAPDPTGLPSLEMLTAKVSGATARENRAANRVLPESIALAEAVAHRLVLHEGVPIFAMRSVPDNLTAADAPLVLVTQTENHTATDEGWLHGRVAVTWVHLPLQVEMDSRLLAQRLRDAKIGAGAGVTGGAVSNPGAPEVEGALVESLRVSVSAPPKLLPVSQYDAAAASKSLANSVSRAVTESFKSMNPYTRATTPWDGVQRLAPEANLVKSTQVGALIHDTWKIGVTYQIASRQYGGMLSQIKTALDTDLVGRFVSSVGEIEAVKDADSHIIHVGTQFMSASAAHGTATVTTVRAA